MNKRKVVNDPVYGFISIPNEFIFDIIEHPYFQRLRRIKQLGLTHLVYPGAMHTRFSHALGAMHLLNLAVQTLRGKGSDISEAEHVSVMAAILMHDIGHGPFSHALESELIEGLHHEELSLHLMSVLNEDFGGQLDQCIEIFTGKHPKNFLHELVSSQLDMDRLDYLTRDTYFTGVSEGVVGWDRIIKMLAVHDDRLVVEEKGVHSLEKFVIARRIMYWQVYLHKAALSAELMLMSVLRRARHLSRKGVNVNCSDALKFFLTTDQVDPSDPKVLEIYCKLDDYDIAQAMKDWCGHEDFILRDVSSRLLNRKLFKLQFLDEGELEEHVERSRARFMKSGDFSKEHFDHYLLHGEVSNVTYSTNNKEILLLGKDGNTRTLDQHSDLIPSLRDAGGEVVKSYLCTPFEFMP